MKKVFEVVTAGKRISLWEGILETKKPKVRTQFNIRQMSDAVMLHFGTHFVLMEPADEFVSVEDKVIEMEVAVTDGD